MRIMVKMLPPWFSRFTAQAIHTKEVTAPTLISMPPVIMTILMSDTNLLLTITVVVFFILYLSAIVFLGGSFTKPQNFLNILNNNASLIVLSCGMGRAPC